MNKVIVIGAGPAGLLCAHELKKMGISSTILESGDSPAQSWLNMPDTLKLGPWVSTLITKNIPFSKMFTEPTAVDFADHLIDFAASSNFKIIPNQRVTSIDKNDGYFCVRTESSEVYLSQCVVNATGYFKNPHFPDWVDSNMTCGKIIHYSGYKNEDKLAKSKFPLSILIVGGGISAGELLMNLINTPHRITLSTRSKIKFEKPKWLQLMVSPIYFWLESKIPTFNKFGSSKRYMAGGRTKKIINSDRVRLIGPIQGVEGKYLRHGSSLEEFDIIFLATGWKSNLKHLNPKLLNSDGDPFVENLQSKIWPGIFFLGFDNLLSFKSRFIRGIREDAKHLAVNIQKYLELKKEIFSKT